MLKVNYKKLPGNKFAEKYGQERLERLGFVKSTENESLDIMFDYKRGNCVGNEALNLLFDMVKDGDVIKEETK